MDYKLNRQYTDNFLAELDKLNAAQRQAVETIEGPVLVIAGPGTGKTQILAARIGNILLNTDARPENILCLTYTDAGALAMRNRLIAFIGPDAYRVKIATFHSFCNEVIQDNPDYFGYRSLQPVADLEKIQILRTLVDGFGPGHPLKRWTGDVYYETYRLDKLFQLMKTESWSLEFIKERARAYMAGLPLRDEYIYKRGNASKGIAVGDLKKDKIAAEEKKMEQLVAAAGEFARYEELLKKYQRYDFADMILWVKEAFKNHPALLATYQERFLYFLVDEFQDTSGSQNELLALLTDFWDEPNVFAVGDDDQSIYRFQGANVQNIEAFAKKYISTLNVVVLTENYRSVPAVLDTATGLIQHNRERLVNHPDFSLLEKKLSAANKQLQLLVNKPIIRRYRNVYEETVHIAAQLETLKNSGARLADVAVIYRNHRQCDELVKYLEVKQVPYYIKKKVDLLYEPLVVRVINLLRYISTELQTPHSGEHLLFEILHYEFFNIRPIDIARMSIDISRKNFKERTTSFRDELLRTVGKQAPTLFDQHFTVSGMKRLGEDIEYWLSEAENVTLQTLLEKIINRSGILAHVMKSPDKFRQLEMLNVFFDFVKEESEKNPTITVHQLIRTIDLMLENGVELPYVKMSGSADGVNLITAHSSKGLEFEHVFLLGCTSSVWDKAGRTGTYPLPDNIVGQTVSTEEDNETEEARRLFFVALTRARQHLYISYSTKNAQEKETERSRFVAEIEHLPSVEHEDVVVEQEAMAEFIEHVLKPAPLPKLELVEKQYLDELLKNYSLSVTHLSNYLRCPVSFYFDNLLRVPAPQNEYMAFGSAVHGALESLFRKMLADAGKRWPEKEVFVDDFKFHISRYRESFTKEQYERRLAYGMEILPGYYDKYVNSWNKVVTVERALRHVFVDNMPLNGKLDKIEFDGNTAVVVDYKTGNPANARDKFKRPLDGADKETGKFEEVYGGDYWRQGVFYKILMDNDKTRDWEMRFAEFDFVEPDKKTKEYTKQRLDISPGDVAAVRAQVRYAWEGIMNHRFSEGCGREDCAWCNFVVFNKINL